VLLKYTANTKLSCHRHLRTVFPVLVLLPRFVYFFSSSFLSPLSCHFIRQHVFKTREEFRSDFSTKITRSTRISLSSWSVIQELVFVILCISYVHVCAGKYILSYSRHI
jgi:hypothetical protein